MDLIYVVVIVIAVIILGLVVLVVMQRPTFRVERSIKIVAPAAKVFGAVNDFHCWELWSPWVKIDPNMQQTYSGPAAGTGANYHWQGNKNVGEGRMTIIESKPSELVRIKLEFMRPFAATNEAVFTFHPEGGQTLATWAMTGTKSFLIKAVHLVFNMDKMVGGMFEKGLAQLKTVAEADKQ